MILTALIILAVLFLFPLRSIFIARWRDIIPLIAGGVAAVKIIEMIPYPGYTGLKILGGFVIAVLVVRITKPIIDDLFPRGGGNGN